MSRVSQGLRNHNESLAERLVTLGTGTTVIVPETHQGKLLMMSTANVAYTLTLPVATGSGDVYEFLSTIVRTSGSIVINATHGAASNLFVGTLRNHTSASTVVKYSSTVNDKITLNITTTGGAAAGDRIRLVDWKANTWWVDGEVFSSGANATSFSG